MTTKVSKTLADFEGQTPSFEARLEIFDKEANKNKFWRCAVYGEFVYRHWGRHGTTGQTLVERYYSDYAAKQAGRNLAHEKRNKGYQPEASVLDRFAREV